MRDVNFAGYFYPSSREKIIEFINKNEKNIPYFSKNFITAIVPHAGWEYSGKCALYVYKNLKKFKDIIIIATNHSQIGKIVLSLEDIRTPLGIIKTNKNFIKKILKEIEFSDVNEVIHSNEHSIEVQLPFLQYYLKDFEIIPILVSNLDFEEVKRFSNFLKENLDFKDTAIIFSGDLIHHGKIYDFEIFKESKARNVKNADLDIINSILEHDLQKFLQLCKRYYTVCGYFTFQIFIEISRLLNLKSELLCYYNSGEITKNEEIVVGYSAIVSY